MTSHLHYNYGMEKVNGLQNLTLVKKGRKKDKKPVYQFSLHLLTSETSILNFLYYAQVIVHDKCEDNVYLSQIYPPFIVEKKAI